MIKTNIVQPQISKRNNYHLTNEQIPKLETRNYTWSKKYNDYNILYIHGDDRCRYIDEIQQKNERME